MGNPIQGHCLSNLDIKLAAIIVEGERQTISPEKCRVAPNLWQASVMTSGRLQVYEISFLIHIFLASPLISLFLPFAQCQNPSTLEGSVSLPHITGTITVLD